MASIAGARQRLGANHVREVHQTGELQELLAATNT